MPGAEGARPGPEEKTLKAAEQDREDVAEARAAWRAELAGVDPARLVFIDETGIDTRMTRPYARAARGERAVGKVPRGRWERLTVIGALALDGLVASRGVAAATGTAVFLAFAEEVLIPALRERPDALVVMDNLGAHKAEAVRGALDRAGLGHRYLPSYSPDMNPIEQAWSKLKAGCGRSARARGRPWRRPSARRSPPSPRRMPAAGSASPATRPRTDPQSALGTTRRVSLAPDEAQADGDSYSPALSPDGRLVTFESDATNLVPGDTNGVTDVFVRAR